MLTLPDVVVPDTPEWHHFYKKLQNSTTLAGLVLTAWQIGLWFAKTLVEQQLNHRAQQPQNWENCSQCGARLQSKGFVRRRMLTLVGWVEWKRRVGRCPNHCPGSDVTPFDAVLEIRCYQQTSVELMRLGCLLAVFLPFELATQVLAQLCGVQVSDDTVWQWVQSFGQQALQRIDTERVQQANAVTPNTEPLAAELAALPLVIAADGVISNPLERT